MTKLCKAMPLLLICAALIGLPLTAQTQDCSFTFNFTYNATQPAVSNLSSDTPCVNWRITLSTTGSLTTTATFYTSPDNITFTAVPNTICSSTVQPPCILQGANPIVGTQGMMYVAAYGTYVRLVTSLSGGAGTGTIRGYGAKGASASAGFGFGGGGGSGGTAPVVVTFNTATSTCAPGCTATPSPPAITVTHNLNNSAPNVWVYDTSNVELTAGPISSTSANVSVVSFASPQAGTATFSTGGSGPAGAPGAPGANGAGYGGVSATSLTPATTTGATTITASTGLAYVAGSCLRVTSSGTPTAYIVGPVTAYTSGTGSLTFTATTAPTANTCSGAGGSGAHTDWVLSLAGTVGATGSSGTGTGTVGAGTAGQVAVYPSAGTTVGGTTLTANGVVLGGGTSAPSTTSADTSTTHALFATATAPAFRAIVPGDIPTLNQSTSGTAANVTGTVAVANGGTGVTAFPGSSGNVLYNNGGALGAKSITITHALGCGVGDPAGAALATGIMCYITSPTACTIQSWDLNVDSGTATFGFWKLATGTAIPTVTNSIVASAAPAIATGTALHGTTLTGWTTSVAQYDQIAVNLTTTSGPKWAYAVVNCDEVK